MRELCFYNVSFKKFIPETSYEASGRWRTATKNANQKNVRPTGPFPRVFLMQPRDQQGLEMFQFFGFELLVHELIFLEFLLEPPRKTILFDSLPGMLLNVLITNLENNPNMQPQTKHRINGHKWREHPSPFPVVSGGDNFPQPASNLLRLAHKCLGQFGLPGSSLATRFWEGSVRFTKKEPWLAPKFGEIRWTWNPPSPNFSLKWSTFIRFFTLVPVIMDVKNGSLQV